MLPLDVTLVYFSGLPDPKWQLTSANPKYPKIQELLNSAVDQELVSFPEQMPSQLGYRGFLVRDGNNEITYLLLGTSTKELQQLVLSTIPPNTMPQELITGIAKVIEEGSTLPIETPETPGTKRTPKFNMFTQWKWNYWPTVSRNNCYNYANNKRTNTNAQPGLQNNIVVKAPLDKMIVKKAAEADGLVELTQPVGKDPPTREQLKLTPAQHLVALFVSLPDFHWYRQDMDNTWSQKNGVSKATNKVYNNEKKAYEPILDPRDVGEYIRADYHKFSFVCFMISDKNKVKIK